jgi:hypothetical protein
MELIGATSRKVVGGVEAGQAIISNVEEENIIFVTTVGITAGEWSITARGNVHEKAQ